MSEGLPLDPIKEERTFDVKGSFIVHMEFLYPSPEDKDQVLLVLFLIESVHTIQPLYKLTKGKI
jgi:hypothetical protein